MTNTQSTTPSEESKIISTEGVGSFYETKTTESLLSSQTGGILKTSSSDHGDVIENISEDTFENQTTVDESESKSTVGLELTTEEKDLTVTSELTRASDTSEKLPELTQASESFETTGINKESTSFSEEGVDENKTTEKELGNETTAVLESTTEEEDVTQTSELTRVSGASEKFTEETQTTETNIESTVSSEESEIKSTDKLGNVEETNATENFLYSQTVEISKTSSSIGGEVGENISEFADEVSTSEFISSTTIANTETTTGTKTASTSQDTLVEETETPQKSLTLGETTSQSETSQLTSTTGPSKKYTDLENIISEILRTITAPKTTEWDQASTKRIEATQTSESSETLEANNESITFSEENVDETKTTESLLSSQTEGISESSRSNQANSIENISEDTSENLTGVGDLENKSTVDLESTTKEKDVYGSSETSEKSTVKYSSDHQNIVGDDETSETSTTSGKTNLHSEDTVSGIQTSEVNLESTSSLEQATSKVTEENNSISKTEVTEHLLSSITEETAETMENKATSVQDETTAEIIKGSEMTSLASSEKSISPETTNLEDGSSAMSESIETSSKYQHTTTTDRENVTGSTKIFGDTSIISEIEVESLTPTSLESTESTTETQISSSSHVKGTQESNFETTTKLSNTEEYEEFYDESLEDETTQHQEEYIQSDNFEYLEDYEDKEIENGEEGTEVWYEYTEIAENGTKPASEKFDFL